MKVLVVGGAGYIGSYMVKWLIQLGCQVTTLDDLSSGHRDAVLNADFLRLDRRCSPIGSAAYHH
jgi:UDP-glucose 4-epimerase